jgi:hypothetical protein
MLASRATSVPGFDTASLSAPVPASEISRFRAEVRGNPVYAGMTRATLGLVVGLGAYLVLGLVIELIVAGLPINIVFAVNPDNAIPGLITTVVLAPVVAFLLWRWLAPKAAREVLLRGSWRRRLVLDRFAEANGLNYYPELRSPVVIGTVFETGPSRIAWDVFIRPGLEVGNYRTADRYNRAVAPDGWAFVRILLNTSVPHLLLLPRRSRVPARTIAPIRAAQRLQLEGDFDRHFTLYVPAGYERDALYVITPDLMALLIDRVPGAFVEMIGQHLTIAIPGTADAALATTWDWIEQVRTTVGRKTIRQTTRYQDHRSPVRGRVATGGRSLRRGVSVAVVGGILMLALHLLPLIHGL